MTRDQASRLLERNRDAAARAAAFRMFGRHWVLLPGVFSPILCPSTRLLASWLEVGAGRRMLEIGCGTGVISVQAALAGARVRALDISPFAVENTRRNVAAHGVEDLVEVGEGNMFEPLRSRERFDVVFWNSSFVDGVPAGAADDLSRTIFDPGYVAHRAYLAGARAHLAAGGQLLIGFGSPGNRAHLDRLCAEFGWQVRMLRSSGTLLPDVEYQLLALVDVERRTETAVPPDDRNAR